MDRLPRVRRLVPIVGLLVTGVVLTGCANHEEPAPPGAGTSASYGNPVSPSSPRVAPDQADVTFLDHAIRLRRQGIDIADLARQNGTGSALRALASQVAQLDVPRVDKMALALSNWGQPVPLAGSGGAVPGLLTADQIGDLRAMRGTAFDDRWKQDMGENLDGSLRACQTEQLAGADPRTKQLAEQWSGSLQDERTKLSELSDQT